MSSEFNNDDFNIISMLGDLNGRLTALENRVSENTKDDKAFQKDVLDRLSVIHDDMERRKAIQNWTLKVTAIVGPIIIGIVSILEFYFQVL
jgi:hypothetical protein